MHKRTGAWRSLVLGLLSVSLLAGCGGLVSKGTTSAPTPKATATSSPKKEGAPTGVAPGGVRVWSVGGVSFRGPNWQSSQIASLGLPLLNNPANSIVLEKTASTFIEVVVGADTPSEEAGEIANALTANSGQVTSGPLPIPGADGQQVGVYYLTMEGSSFTPLSAEVGYWYSGEKAVSVMCAWAQQTNGLQMQGLCQGIFNSLTQTKPT